MSLKTVTLSPSLPLLLHYYFFFFVIIEVHVDFYAIVLVLLSNNVESVVCIHCHIRIPPVSALNAASK